MMAKGERLRRRIQSRRRAGQAAHDDECGDRSGEREREDEFGKGDDDIGGR
jgi:hypothetical protein